MGNRIARIFMLLRKRRIPRTPHPVGPTVRHLGSPPLRGEDNALVRPYLDHLDAGHEPGYRLEEARRHALYVIESEAWA